MSRSDGFTLVETLVTMALLAFVILVGSSAFSFFAQRWDGELGNFNATLQRARDQILIQEVLESLVPYVVHDEKNKPVLYFEGNRNGFVSVSNRSIYGQGSHSVVRFSVVQNTDLSYNVLYEEWPMIDNVLRTMGQSIDFSEPLVMFESVHSPVFQYLGWSSLEDKNGRDGVSLPKPAEWLPAYNSLVLPLTPLKVRLSFQDGDESYVIPATIAKQKSGLVSRYSGSRQRVRNASGELTEVVDECYC